MKQILLPVGEIFLFPGSPGDSALIGTISLPDAQALRETDLDPSLDPWAEIERLKPLEKMLEMSPPARSVPQAAE